MDTKEFLQLVVPWQLGGYVTIHWHRPENKTFFGRSFQSVEAALDMVADLKTKTQYNIYFCISHQKLNSGQRNRQNALGLSCLAMDVDVKPGDPKCYQTISEATEALLAFCTQTGIPGPSLLVATGGGLHAYWLSDTVLPVEEWQPYADGLKYTALKAGLKFDPVCTGDAARVMRVPDTLNWKYGEPRPVCLVQQACNGLKYDFATTFAGVVGAAPPSRTTAARPAALFNIEVADAFKHLPVEKIDLEYQDIPPLPFAPIKAECGFLQEAYDTGGVNYNEPLWNFTTLIATFLENGHQLAHQFGNQHATYDPGQTDEKWRRKLQDRKTKQIGWPSCRAIADAGSSHCAGCKHFNKIKSPISIGYTAYAEPDDEDLKELGGSRPPQLRLPEGYCVDEHGRLCAIIPAKRTKGKIQPPRLLALLLTVIGNTSLQFKDGQFGVGFLAETDRSGGKIEVFLEGGNCFGLKLFNYLSSHGVLYSPHREARAQMELFAPAWLDLLKKSDVAVRDSGTMGWRYDKEHLVGFVYGNTLFLDSGSERSLVASADDEFRSWYMPVGNREVWVKAAKLLTDRKRPELDLIIAIGFAAPLMTFAGTLYGAILSIWGHPGTGKSTAQQVAAALWGHPKQTRESLNSTPKSVQGRLGRCRNLAAFWDDIQDERHQDALFQTMFVATQGTEGGRLNQDSTMKERLEWQTLLVACSNASFVEYLVKKQKSTTAGMRRVFEIEFNKKDDEPGLINAVDAGEIFAALERNYGMIGIEYARILAREHKEIRQTVIEVSKAFCAQVEGTNDENYWWGSCAVLLVGAMMANRLGAEIDLTALSGFLAKAFQYNRNIRRTEGTEGGSYQNTEQGLTAFVNYFVGSGHSIGVNKLWRSKHQPIEVLHHPGQSRYVALQLVRDQRLVLISKRELRGFLHKHEIQPRQVIDGLKTFFNAREVRHTLGAGTAYAQSQEICYELDVPEDRPHVLSELMLFKKSEV